MSHQNSWIGVDLDGTLAQYDKWRGEDNIGPAIEPMLKRVKDWIEGGKTVKIFTARAATPSSVPFVEKWLEANGIGGLQVTNIKDMGMVVLYDDRAVQVEKNTGRLIGKENENA